MSFLFVSLCILQIGVLAQLLLFIKRGEPHSAIQQQEKDGQNGNNNVDGADITVNDDVQQFPSSASHPRSEVPHDGKWFSTTDEWKTAIQRQQQQKNTKWTKLIKQQYIKTREETFFFSLEFEFLNKMDLSFVIDMKLVTRGLKYLVNLTR